MISNPSEDVATASSKPSTGVNRIDSRSWRDSKEQGRVSGSEWIDVDESPPRKRRSGKRSSHRHSRSSRSASGSELGQREESKPHRFFPRLTNISEGNESVVSSNRSSKGQSRQRHRDRSRTRRSQHRSDASAIQRVSTKLRADTATKKSVAFLNANPSLISLLSAATTGSDRSSRSGSTVTQQSYDRQTGRPSRESSNVSKRRSSPLSSSMVIQPPTKPLNVFDFMESSAVDDGQDGHSVASSISYSSPVHSDAGSSQAPDTPSSRSTFPSPTTTRSQLVPELRKKFDSQHVNSTRSSSKSPDPPSRNLRKRSSVSAVPEEDEDGAVSFEADIGPQRRPSLSSQSSFGSRRRSVQLHQQVESMQQHIAYNQQPYYIDPVYGQRRSFSSSSVHTDRSGVGHWAMQQYQWPPQHLAGAPPTPPQALNDQSSPTGPLGAPQPPDLSKLTLTGYEQIALELSTTESPVKPLYRKFEYLNHRVLLHLQDALCDLEEELRTIDEAIAQTEHASPDGQKTPASRRGDAFLARGGSELHNRRANLLGSVLVSTEHYNRALSAYASIAKESVSPDDDQVASYVEWMTKHAPVHPVETRFLRERLDLIVPGATAATLGRPTKHAALAYLPVALMLPLLLYSIIPSLTGRLVVTAFIAIGAFIVAATTKIRQLMPAREWAVCGCAYVLLMAAIAGCIPSHA